MYAAEGVRAYWLVDVPGRSVEVHERPDAAGRYRRVRVLGADDSVDLPVIGEPWPVAERIG